MLIPDNRILYELLISKVSPSIILATKNGPSKFMFGFSLICLVSWIADDVNCSLLLLLQELTKSRNKVNTKNFVFITFEERSNIYI